MATKRKQKPLTPAALAAARFGGVRKLGRLLGAELRVGQWISRGGDIPSQNGQHRALLALAEKHGVKLTADEIINGGTL